MPTSIEAYYDEFLSQRMINYRIDGNLRIDYAINLLIPYLSPFSTVADIGCGIGIVAEALAKYDPSIRVFGVDISKQNIEYARRTISLENVEFIVASVQDQFEEMGCKADKGIDVICMVDVIEHIPEKDRKQLFKNLNNVASDDAVLVLTYPSPEYQRYLVNHNPDELQLVDNIIQLPVLLNDAQFGGWSLLKFNYVDVWRKNQYIHAVFTRSISVKENAESSMRSFFEKLSRLIDRKVFRPARVKRYAKKPFENWPFS